MKPSTWSLIHIQHVPLRAGYRARPASAIVLDYWIEHFQKRASYNKLAGVSLRKRGINFIEPYIFFTQIPVLLCIRRSMRWKTSEASDKDSRPYKLLQQSYRDTCSFVKVLLINQYISVLYFDLCSTPNHLPFFTTKRRLVNITEAITYRIIDTAALFVSTWSYIVW